MAAGRRSCDDGSAAVGFLLHSAEQGCWAVPLSSALDDPRTKRVEDPRRG